MPPWDLSIVEMGDVPAGSPMMAGPENFVPPAIQPPGPSLANPAVTNAAPSPSSAPAAAVATIAAPPAPPVSLTEDQTRAVVMIEGDQAEGTGFLVKMPDGPVVVTNLHVIAGNANIRILTNTGAQITTLGLKGATDRDLAIFPIKDANYSYLDLDTTIDKDVHPGDEVITPGNSEGGEVVLSTRGSVIAVGPQRIEFSNPIYHGNSGGPVFHSKTGKVLAVVTEAVKVENVDDLDKASFASHDSAISGEMRYFGLRLDTVPQWEAYDPARFQTETTFLEEFHQQSRRIDSYLNSSEKTDSAASKRNDDNARPDSKLYLSDDKIVKAHDAFLQQANGGDASQRLDAFRGWLFALDGIAETNVTQIQAPDNFYQFDRQRARQELSYRKALEKELDSFGDDISRAESLGIKN